MMPVWVLPEAPFTAEALRSWRMYGETTTEIPSTLKRPGVVRGVLHEGVDQARMFESVVAASYCGIEEVGQAWAAASEMGRPVYLEIPTDQLR